MRTIQSRLVGLSFNILHLPSQTHFFSSNSREDGVHLDSRHVVCSGPVVRRPDEVDNESTARSNSPHAPKHDCSADRYTNKCLYEYVFTSFSKTIKCHRKAGQQGQKGQARTCVRISRMRKGQSRQYSSPAAEVEVSC